MVKLVNFMNKKINMIFRLSLQARSLMISSLNRFRMICSKNKKGSAVVEAVALVPMFLCAICTLLVIGEMLLTQMQIKYTVSETAGRYAASEAVFENNKIMETAELYQTFYSLLENNQLFECCIVGGRTGIIVSGKKEEEHVKVTATYLLKVPVPYYKEISFPVKCTIQKRIFSGYVEHEGEEEERDPVVYVTEHGTVYHRTMTCSHICLKVSGRTSIENITAHSSLKPCKKCITSGETYTTIYMTVEGDAYHSTLSCSGLKRTVKAIRLSEVEGMRECSRCGNP